MEEIKSIEQPEENGKLHEKLQQLLEKGKKEKKLASTELIDALEEIDADEKQAEHMMQGIHRIFSRGVQTRDDAAIMLGVARQALWAHHNPALEGRKPSIA